MNGKVEAKTWEAHAHRLASMLLISCLLAACGGGSGSGVASPAAEGSGIASTSAAPGNSSTTPPVTSAPPTLKEQIAALERSGAYPVLDRSSDIAGPDSNSNGVRDDIENWINAQKLSDSQKKALMQDARATQRTLLVDLNDKAALQRAGEGLASSSNCGLIQFSPYATFSKLAGQIEAMTANTRQRAERYMKYNAARSGSSTSMPEGNTCEP
jgi:hypothetical protein